MAVAPTLIDNRQWSERKTPHFRVRTTIAPHVVMMIVWLMMCATILWIVAQRYIPQGQINIYDGLCAVDVGSVTG